MQIIGSIRVSLLNICLTRPTAFDDCDKVENVRIGQVRQASPESRSGPTSTHRGIGD